MIKIDEIRSVAAQVGLSNLVVEKDYALGWLLWGINSHPITSKSFVFKGGTCLKKCYFETYRFSEDLDFSYRGQDELSVETLTQVFSETVFEESGLEFLKPSIQFERFKNPRESFSIQGGLKYRGPVRPQVGIANMPRIKLDVTLDEPIVLAPVVNDVLHMYSDEPSEGISILSYSYEEIFAEKIRALAQRLRPRDLYDVVHLYRHKNQSTNPDIISSVLEKKCKIRGISVPTITSIETHSNRAFLESEWDTQLKHQVSNLSGFQDFLNALPEILSWLRGT